MYRAKISSRWQVVIPKKIRKQMGLEIGGALAFQIKGDHAVVYPLDRDPVKALFGMYKGVPLTERLKDERAKDLVREEKKMRKPGVADGKAG